MVSHKDIQTLVLPSYPPTFKRASLYHIFDCSICWHINPNMDEIIKKKNYLLPSSNDRNHMSFLTQNFNYGAERDGMCIV